MESSTGMDEAYPGGVDLPCNGNNHIHDNLRSRRSETSYSVRHFHIHTRRVNPTDIFFRASSEDIYEFKAKWFA
jgi:hypothetical protein